jgi:hypothetical protein
VRSVQANSAGFLLALVSIAVIVAAVLTAFTGQTPGHRFQWCLCVVLIAIFVIAMLEWGVRLLA